MASPQRVKIDKSFKFDNGRGYYENDKAWVKLRILPDKILGECYLDVLFGSKGGKAHVHYALNADLSRKFLETRDSLNTLNVKAVDSDLGVIENSTTRFKPEQGKNKVSYTILADGASRTIRVLFDEVKLESK